MSDTIADAPKCGIVMPISSIDGCTTEHWSDVKSIVIEAVESVSTPKFLTSLVSDADDVGVIQKRIVQNLYTADVVICDVSGKNPNVMFELGMRLAFDKPTVIIKDDKTDYSFDTGIIEHLTYPRDLRFNRVVGFKKALAEKISATYTAAANNPDHSVFLKNFGTFRAVSINQEVAPADRIVVDMMSEMQGEMVRMRRELMRLNDRSFRNKEIASSKILDSLMNFSSEHPDLDLISLKDDPDFLKRMEIETGAKRYFLSPASFQEELRSAIEALNRLK